jgi:hypothetical protein
MLSYAPAGGKDYVCSGWGERSDWVKNILADPLVTVQVGRHQYTGKAYRVVDVDEFTTVAEKMFLTGGDSHFQPWLESYDIRFKKKDMIAKRDRLFIIGFEPVEQEGPPSLQADLRWIWPILVIVILITGAAFLLL